MTTRLEHPSIPPHPIENALRCSVCDGGVVLTERVLQCVRGHSFDRARQGYFNLLHAKVSANTADTGPMVAARKAFLDAGFYAPLTQALTETLDPSSGTEIIIDAGSGTGHHLAFVLEQRPQAYGLALDASVPALRRAARIHKRVTAVCWNLWQPWPIVSGSADIVFNIFAPRNPAEFHRVLRPNGKLIIVTPDTRHLVELSEFLGLLNVDEDKQQRLDATLAERFVLLKRQQHDGTVSLSPTDIRHVVLMGPNAHHLHRGDLSKRLDHLVESINATTSLQVSTYRRAP